MLKWYSPWDKLEVTGLPPDWGCPGVTIYSAISGEMQTLILPIIQTVSQTRNWFSLFSLLSPKMYLFKNTLRSKEKN